MSTHLPISSIRIDATLQSRASIDPVTVNEYAEAMSAGASFPPIDVFLIDGQHVVADGFHRLLASQGNGDATIPVIVHPGGRDAAVRHALGANARHGLKRTNADKRRAVEIALKEFSDMSDSAIAQMCGVSQPFVGSMRPKQPITVIGSPADPAPPPPARKGLDGKTRKAPAPKAPKTPAQAPAVMTDELRAQHRANEAIIERGLGAAREVMKAIEQSFELTLKTSWESASKQERDTFLVWALELAAKRNAQAKETTT